ncbi:hypothetical protein AO373_1422 [Moraxella catarrhalis]|nr:hypothetical protein AO379_1551 [Moraxella catarrhalis]OAV18185.1 hypothetical protein AO373_1422 [Moraxella catarrhalis]OAV24338.1 hypothetical protein AO369_1632 [Moraxella catarrhalis]
MINPILTNKKQQAASSPMQLATLHDFTTVKSISLLAFHE